MTEVKYNRIELALSIRGHAGYAESGKDIVCAGVSALFFAAYAELRNRGFRYFADLDDGYATLQAYPSAEERHTCITILDTVVAGLDNLAQHYPENIKLIKEER